MIFVFEVRLAPGYRAEQYAEAWVRASEYLQRAHGARGTQLHRAADSTDRMLAIASWETKADRDAMEANQPEAARAIIASQAEFVDINIIGEFEDPEWLVLPDDAPAS